MVTGHVFIATSLDGFIARSDGDIGWLLERDDPSENYGYEHFIEKIDGIVMGRGSFEKIIKEEVWHYSKPVIVLSKTLSQSSIPDRLIGKVKILSLSLNELIDYLDNEGWKRVYVDGGQVIQSFLRENLIEDMVITRVPVLIGQGRSLFGNLIKDIPLDHLETISFPSGLVKSHYRICQK